MFKLELSDHEPTVLDADQRRVAVALAEAILPGSERIRPADERTVAATEQVVDHISPWASRAFKAALGLLDRAAIPSTGRRFHKLSRQRQQEVLARWERDPVLRGPLGAIAFAFKFTHFDTREVYESLGGRLNVVQNMEEPRWLGQFVEATDWDASEEIECEVAVVGTGAGGAVVGKELADRGYAVCFVEEGGHHRRDAFTGSSLQAHFDFYRGSLTLGNAPMPIFMGRLVGGSTAVNTGSCFRTPPWVLDRWCEELDTDEFEPERMRPHFDRVERTLSVEPADRDAIGPIADIMARGCDALGWEHRRMLRNAPGCKGEGFCDFGCRTDARKSTNLSYVPPALEKGAMCFTGLRATRVRVEHGRAVGLEGVDAHGRTLKVRADAVIFAGGALPTPVFLQKQGICNSSGQVGRNLTVHPSTGFSALMREPVDPHVHIPQGYYVHEHLREGILVNAAQPDKNFGPLLFPQTGDRLMQVVEHLDRMASFGVMIADSRPSGVVHAGPGGMPVVRYSLTKADVDRMHRGFVHAGRMAWAGGAERLYPVCVSMPEVRDRDEWRRFEQLELKASDLMLTSYHPLGTCRMGTDPKTSVVDLDHQTHDVKNLFLVDGSTVPGPLGVNPQITIMAMATRAAARIADVLG
ncbi:MAG TPA: GMC family oxidoreductase [Sandaracinaceae bacterium LLY-WYZ-13_1]|nr:GMC family oxidoreductase [Sandaracinaceae bacterium LLY-WYZ-13_1]